MRLDRIYYIGFTSHVAREELIDVAPAPINYKDPIKIQERIEENTKRAHDTAALCPGIATVDEIQVYTYNGGVAFHSIRSAASPFNPPAVQFWEWLNKTEWSHSRTGYTTAIVPEEFVGPEAFIMGPLFFGFRIKSFLQMAAIETIIHNHATTNAKDTEPSIKVPVQIWRDHVGVGDPYEILFTEEQRRVLTLDKAIQLFFGTALDLKSLYQKPRQQAILACKMVLRGQLLGTDPLGDIGYSEGHEQPKEDLAVGST